MTNPQDILKKRTTASIHILTLGNFLVYRNGEVIDAKEWGREKTIQLFQYLVTARHRRGLHKEQIVDRIWEEMSQKTADSNFKVAMHGINKALEPNRKSRQEPKFVERQGITYQLNLNEIWIDADAMEELIALGNQALNDDPETAETAYREAINLHHGVYIPNRIYEDWTSDERERLQVLAMGAMVTLGELLVRKNPMESVRLAEMALQLDAAWEDAYRVQMEAYFQKGNRPMAIKTYQKCERVLEEEFGIKPLPETRRLFQRVMSVE